MTLLVQRTFRGEVPRLPAHLLPEGAAAFAVNCDLQHGVVTGVRGNAVIASNLLVGTRAVRSVYTEDGQDVFAWSQDVDVVRSQVVEDKWRRIYYTIVYGGTPLIKVARTHRMDPFGNVVTKVIGNPLVVGGNWQPPENSTPGAGFGNTGPDSWLLGVPYPDLAANGGDDATVPPTLSLLDRPTWPEPVELAMRVTFFLETPTGEIVSQVDISNTETPPGLSQVYYTYSGNNDDRGHKIQDMMYPLGETSRPFKYYWYLPPETDSVSIGRTVTVTNAGPGAIVIEYGKVDPTDPIVTWPIDQA